MFDESHDEDLFGASDALEALAELEQNTNHAILAQRATERIDICVKIHVQPANASERHRFGAEGVTADISNGGCMVLTSRPLIPGDLYWITFDSEQTRIGSLFARCLRSRFVREDAFEAGMRFLNEIDVASSIVSQSDRLNEVSPTR